MSNDQPSRRAAGSSGGGAPISSTVSIVIAVVAVVVGFLVLRNINDSDAGGSKNGGTNTAPISDDSTGTETTVPTVPVETGPPTTPPLNLDATQQIIVANASGLGGAAGQYSKALGGLGFTMGTPTDATEKVALSVVYYLPGGEAVAASVAQAMGSLTNNGVVTAALPTPAPVAGGVIEAGATVLVLLGTDLAGKALPILAGTTSTTLPGAPIDSTTTVG